MWTRIERDGKDGVLAAIAELTDAGVPVPSALAIADLRALRYIEQEGGARVPAYRVLAARWGWGAKKAFLLMENEARWTNPEGGVFGRRQGANGEQEGSNEGATREQPKTVEAAKPADEGAVREQEGSNEGATRDTRAILLVTNTSTNTTTTSNKKPKREKTKTPSGESKNKSPYTEAWSKAWATATDGKPYPWGSYFRALATVKELPPPADPEKLEAEMLRAIRSGTTDFTRWAWKAKDSHRRTLVKAPTETTDDLLALFGEPEPPQVSAPQPPPKPAYDPMKDCNSPEYREREMQELARERAERAEIRRRREAALGKTL